MFIDSNFEDGRKGAITCFKKSNNATQMKKNVHFIEKLL